jgi:hypothetical protein
MRCRSHENLGPGCSDVPPIAAVETDGVVAAGHVAGEAGAGVDVVARAGDVLAGGVVDGPDGLVRGRQRGAASKQHDLAAGAVHGSRGVVGQVDIVGSDIAVDGVAVAVAEQFDKIVGAGQVDRVAAAGQVDGVVAGGHDGVADPGDGDAGALRHVDDGVVLGDDVALRRIDDIAGPAEGRARIGAERNRGARAGHALADAGEVDRAARGQGQPVGRNSVAYCAGRVSRRNTLRYPPYMLPLTQPERPRWMLNANGCGAGVSKSSLSWWG